MNRSRPALIALLVGALTLEACSCGSPPVDPLGAEFKETAVQINLSGGFPETPTSGFDPRPSFIELREKLRLIRDEPRAKGLLLRIGSSGGDLAQLRDIAELVGEIRAKEKPVHCHFDRADNASYLFAIRACERITMSPPGTLDLIGFATQLVFAAELLESLGVNAEMIAIGQYKSAADALTKREMPIETREVLSGILDQYTAALIEGLEERAGEGAKEIPNKGPFLAQEALDLNLVDAVEYLDEARDALKKAAAIDRLSVVSIIPESAPPSLGELFAMGREKKLELPEPYLAVVSLSGNILDGAQSDPSNIYAGPVVKRLDELAKDPNAKGVLVRISSPGGSALASDLIYRSLAKLNEIKPVVISIGSMAASGGYYIAAAGREIFAAEESLIGSIGVVGGKLDLSAMLEKIGLHTESLQRGDNSLYMSPFSAFTASEREAVERQLRGIYDLFIDRVAEGRGKDRAEIEAVAEGRVYTAKQGLPLGMVDHLGGFEEALARALELAELDKAATLRFYPKRKDILTELSELFSGGSGEIQSEAVFKALPEGAKASLEWLQLFASGDGIFARLPYELHIR